MTKTLWVIYLKIVIYQIYIFCKKGCYDIYILETSEMSQFSTAQQNTRVTNISK